MLTLLGFFQFPGHTYLQSDTQIYVPILEHLRDPGTLARDFLARDPHVSFTIYDEVALGSGLDLRTVLTAEQLVFRALGLLGIYLIATSMGLRSRMALLVTAVFSLGATIGGPAVLSIEYEPVPRGFAIPLLFLAMGLVAHGRDLGAGIAGALAFLHHPPSTLPFWAFYFLLTLWPARPEVMKRRIFGLAPLLAAVLLLFALSRMQTGISEPQDFFSRIDPGLEQLQRMRAPYNWISQWPSYWITQYLVLCGVALAAFWRVRGDVPKDLRAFLAGLPVCGLLAIPLSYVLLEKLRWAVVPQLQPARAALFTAVIAEVLAAVAAVKAAERNRWLESVLWLVPAYALVVNTRVAQVLIPDFTDPLLRTRFALVLALSAIAAAAAWAVARNRKWALAPWAAAIVIPFFAVPGWGRVENYKRIETPELRQLIQWARQSTAPDAMFLFPDAGRNLAPGVFRAGARRALYVDWKGGGQVNFLRGFAREWGERWKLVQSATPDPARYGPLGVDYLVFQSAHRPAGSAPVFENKQFAVVRTR